MRVREYGEPAALLARAEPFLLRAEAENNLLVGLLCTSHAEPPWLASVEAEPPARDPLLVALRTPPYRVVLSAGPADAAQALAAHLHAKGEDVPGVIGDEATAAAFIARFLELRGGRARVSMRQRIYELTRLIEPSPPPGAARVAQAADVPRVAEWIEAFIVHVNLDLHLRARCDRLAREHVARGAIWLWEDAGAVTSMCARTRPTPNGECINMVYTPRERRGRGYATAVVAALSRAILAEGRRFCCLVTDLANPTSNGIYARIGYVPVGDACVIDVDR